MEVARKERRQLRPMLCQHCVETWRRKGKPEGESPQAITPKEIKEGKCPYCGEVFQSYTPF